MLPGGGGPARSGYDWCMGRLLAVVLALVAVSDAAEAQRRRGPPLPAGTVEARIVGLRSDDGRVACAIFDDGDAFPSDRARAVQGKLAPIRDGVAVCRFTGLRAGTYAVAFIHDEDGDGEFDTGLFGIPTEGYGASNDASSTFGPPDWEDARFELGATGRRMRLRTRY